MNDRIQRVERRVKERLLSGEIITPTPDALPFTDVWVEITSTSQTDGYYPGTLYSRSAGVFTIIGAAGDVWVDTPNGETLTTSTKYRAAVSGMTTAGKPIFDVVTFTPASASTPAFVGARRYGTTASMGPGVFTGWSSTEIDTNSFASGNGFAIPSGKAGKYLITASAQTSITASPPEQNWFIQILVNGNGKAGQSIMITNAGASEIASCSEIIELAVGDAITLLINYSAGGTWNVSYAHLAIALLGT